MTDSSNSTLCFRNLNYDTTEESLRKEVAKIAEPVSVRIPSGRRKDKRGFGFVEFKTPEDAKKVLETMDKSDFEGRSLNVEFARSKPHPSRSRRHEYDDDRRSRRRRRRSHRRTT